MARPPLPQLTLHFELAGEKLSLWRGWGCRRFLQYAPAQRKLIASDGWNIVSIDPSDGSQHTLHTTEVQHEISCIVPGTGNVILTMFVHEHRSFHNISHDSNATELVMPDLHGYPFWDRTPDRIIELANGHRIFLLDGHPDEFDDYGIIRLDDKGVCVSAERIDSIVDFRIFCPQNDQRLVYTDGYGIFDFSFDTHEERLLAGSQRVWGCDDGIGHRARFSNLMKPVVSDRYVFVRADGPRWGTWRWARLDLETLQVQTVHSTGICQDELEGYCVTDNEVFALERHSGGTRLLRASLKPPEDSVGLAAAVSQLDLTLPVRPVIFRLKNDSHLEIDRRILTGRSAYFRDMLTSGFREDSSSEIDLTNDQEADEASLSVLLRYVLCDTWGGSRTDSDVAFRVRALADRYRLPRLVELAETLLHDMLGPNTVLNFLGRVSGSGGPLEEACWALMDADGDSILRLNESDVDEIIAQNPVLAKRLIMWQTGSDSERKRKRPRVSSR